VYCYLIENAERELGITPEKIVLVGDSAGANLAAALCILAIQRKYRIPTGILLAYGVFNMNKNDFTPSNLFSLDDGYMTYPFLKICHDSYF